MLMANYGSSEYTQSLSRVGSLFGNLYVISAKDWSIDTIDVETPSVKLSCNTEAIKCNKGLIVGREYAHLIYQEEEYEQ